MNMNRSDRSGLLVDRSRLAVARLCPPFVGETNAILGHAADDCRLSSAFSFLCFFVFLVANILRMQAPTGAMATKNAKRRKESGRLEGV